jgi:hypothetical protein
MTADQVNDSTYYFRKTLLSQPLIINPNITLRKFSNWGLDKTFLNLPKRWLRRSGGRRTMTMRHKNNYFLTA